MAANVLMGILSGLGNFGEQKAEGAQIAREEETRQQTEKAKAAEDAIRRQMLTQSLRTSAQPKMIGQPYVGPGGKTYARFQNADGLISDQALPGPASETPQESLYRGLIAIGVDPDTAKAAVAGKAEGMSADARKRADYAQYIAAHPEYKGSFEAWSAEQAAAGRTAGAPKPKTFDQQYQDTLVKQAKGEPLTDDDKALQAAWDLFTRKKIIDPAVARAAAYGANRYIMVVDPSNPENVIPMRAADAAKAEVSTPASIGFQTDKAVTKAFTSGAPATNINYFNTATDHLKLLGEAAKALNNGDTQLFNRIANSFAAATGDPAPIDFDTVKGAVAGELSKTFKGTGATDQEIQSINTTINSSFSPRQITGAIDYYTRLMNGKLDALKAQYAAAKRGEPNFPGGAATATPPAGATMKVPGSDGKLHWSDGTKDLGVVQ
jgi:hypothetical protein